MRAIKFRAWHRKSQEWHFWNLLDLPGMETQTQIAGGESINVSKLDYRNWCEFTGLKDKNGIEIYEGDIVKCHDHPTGVDSVVGEVYFKDGSFRVKWSMILLCDFAEVIGNIYSKTKSKHE